MLDFKKNVENKLFIKFEISNATSRIVTSTNIRRECRINNVSEEYRRSHCDERT